MEFFREKNGKYHGLPFNTGTGSRANPMSGIGKSLGALVIIAIVFFLNSGQTKSSKLMLPIIMIAGSFLVTSLISLLVHKTVMGSDVIVDQMAGIVSFRTDRGVRITLQTEQLKEIVINNTPEKASKLFLQRHEGSRYLLMSSKDPVKLGMFANELSILTSLTVLEETDG